MYLRRCPGQFNFYNWASTKAFVLLQIIVEIVNIRLNFGSRPEPYENRMVEMLLQRVYAQNQAHTLGCTRLRFHQFLFFHKFVFILKYIFLMMKGYW